MNFLASCWGTPSMKGKVVTLRALIRFIALAVLALAGPVGGLRVGNEPGIQACSCGCGAASESACGCGSMPSMPASSGHRTPSPCQQPPVPSSPTMAAATHAETERSQEDGSDLEKKTEPRPWTPSAAEQASALKNGTWAHLAIHLSRDGTPENCLERLARLSTFRI